jgi:hypothetical protein
MRPAADTDDEDTTQVDDPRWQCCGCRYTMAELTGAEPHRCNQAGPVYRPEPMKVFPSRLYGSVTK